MLGKKLRGPIKSVLAEELENSLRMKAAYEKALRRLPKGCLSKRRISGHDYFYIVHREKGKLVFSYKGKISEKEQARYNEVKENRSRYRGLLSRAKKQIRFLEGALRGKAPI
jgi:hypothetical protein